jgi:hypothetical protein
MSMNSEITMSIEEARLIARTAEALPELLVAEEAVQRTALAGELAKAAERRARGKKEWVVAFGAWSAAMEEMRAAWEARVVALRNWKAVQETMDAEWWAGGLLAHAQRIVAAADYWASDADTADEATIRRRVL